MDDMKLYFAALTLYENNMRILHWKLHGPEFHKTHERFADYYEQLGDYMDETAEQMITLGMNPCSSAEALNIVRDSEIDGFVLDGNLDFDMQTAESASYKMMSQLYTLAEELESEDDLPVDVQDVFTAHARYFRIEGLYKLARRLKM